MNQNSPTKSATRHPRVQGPALLLGVLALVSLACVSDGPRPQRSSDSLGRYLAEPHRGVLRLVGNAHPYLDVAPEIDAGLADLMDRARAGDVVVDLQSRLFDPENLQLGTWKPDAFETGYGTALFLEAPYDPTRKPVFLVHGIGGSPREFAALAEALHDSPYQPVFFFYPTGLAIPEAARALEERMGEFMDRHGVQELALVAHSMGGLVSKTMLDRRQDDRLHCRVFISIASPWAGVDSARMGELLPGHPRSWSDLVPTSATIAGLHSTPFPDETAAYLLFGARGGSAPFTRGNDDGSVALDSVLAPAITEKMDGVFGFYEDHVSILSARQALTQVRRILDDPAPDPGAA